MSIKKDIKKALKELKAPDVAYGKIVIEVADGEVYEINIDKKILYDISKED